MVGIATSLKARFSFCSVNCPTAIAAYDSMTAEISKTQHRSFQTLLFLMIRNPFYICFCGWEASRPVLTKSLQTFMISKRRRVCTVVCPFADIHFVQFVGLYK
jgi:hypothetical protein